MSYKTKIKLKPCPFCGKQARVYTFDHGDGIPAFNIECKRCYFDMGHFENMEELAKYWNRRADNE